MMYILNIQYIICTNIKSKFALNAQIEPWFVIFLKCIVILYLHPFSVCKFLRDLFSNNFQTKVVLPATLNSASFGHKMAICQLFGYTIFLERP